MTHNISDRFTKLRLPGFSNAYMEQSMGTGFKDMSFDDRIALLIDREEQQRANHSIAVRVGKAKFKQSAAFENLKPSASRGLDKTMLQNLGSCDWIRKKQNLLITGPAGSGKTFIGTALSHHACLCGFSARYFRAAQLLSDLEIAKEDGHLRRFISQLEKIQVLIIDDFFLSSISESCQKNLFELIEARHELVSTILTSQNPVSLWHGLMPNLAIADAILDRITHLSVRLELKGESLRKKQVNELDQENKIQA